MSGAIVREALRQGAVTIATMVDIDHPTGTKRFWSGLGTLDYGGEEYIGLGALGSVTPIEGDTEIKVAEVNFQLSGVDPDLIEGLTESVKGREAQVYDIWLDDDYRVIYRDLVLEARLDYQRYSVDPDSGTATISLMAVAGFFHLLNRSGAKVSPEEAKAIYPEETGFDEMHKQQDEQLIWRPAT